MTSEPTPPFSDRVAMRSAAPFPRQAALTGALVALFVIAVALSVAAWFLIAPGTSDDAIGDRGGSRLRPTASAAVAGAAEIPLPPVEPVQYLDLPRDRARAINAGVPFSSAAIPAAAALRVAFSAPDLARAVDCLAAAGYYEAGDDIVGQQAVVQVVLNRMRHPAFPATACGVVFQGSERTTGCQFSFTCDGAMVRRRPSDAAWQRARGTALAALGGYVDAPVGYATHYHTDWVVPNWSAHVDKIARVGTHLFFRWLGAAGTPRAFHQTHLSPEPAIDLLAGLSEAHRPAGDPSALALDGAALGEAMVNGAGGAAPADLAAVAPAATLRGNVLLSATPARDRFVLRHDGAPGAALALVALDLCRLGTGPTCTVSAYAGAPTGQPDFYYLRDTQRSVETLYWDCAVLPPSQSCAMHADGLPAMTDSGVAGDPKACDAG